MSLSIYELPALGWMGPHRKKGERPTVTAICALHKKSQGRFAAVQQFPRTQQEERANLIKKRNLFQYDAGIY
jgi:hypothetical protein